ncbi:FadR/GntR family transcriptional regulator [Bordetella sp. 2513F-2]
MDTAPPPPLRRRSRSLTEEVVSALAARIQAGEILPGQKLPTESEIMAEQGVSRTVVREAISQLQAARLVETRHGIGTFVLSPSEPTGLQIDTAGILTLLDVMAMLELRITLETEAAALAAERRTPAHLREMRRCLADFVQRLERGTGDAVPADRAFHLCVAQAAGNRYYHDILQQLGNALIPRTRVDSAALAEDDRAAYLQRVHREHQAIHQAIEAQDPEAARAAMRTHLGNSRDRVRRAYEAADAARQARA